MKKIVALLLAIVCLMSSSVAFAAKATPTATPKPDYAAMDIEVAAKAVAEAANSNTCTVRSIEIDPEVIFIDVDFGRSYYAESLLIGAVRYAIDVARDIFAHDKAPMIYLRYHEAGRDKYGNAVDMTTITIRLAKATAAKMDLDWMYDSAARTQKLFLDACDGYSLHKDYKGVLE